MIVVHPFVSNKDSNLTVRIRVLSRGRGTRCESNEYRNSRNTCNGTNGSLGVPLLQILAGPRVMLNMIVS